MRSSTTANCFEKLPARAVRRDDIRPGLHLTNYRGRVVIAFAVEGQLKLTPIRTRRQLGLTPSKGIIDKNLKSMVG